LDVLFDSLYDSLEPANDLPNCIISPLGIPQVVPPSRKMSTWLGSGF
jgi:hypothetical protein